MQDNILENCSGAAAIEFSYSANTPISSSIVIANNQITNENQKLNINDIVQLSSDIEFMKIIQKGHGEWAEAMNPVY